MGGFLGSKLGRNRIVVVGNLQDGVMCIALGLCLGISLIMVEVQAAAAGGHHYVVAFTGCLDAAFLSTPAHDGGIRGKAAFQDFIPAHQALAIAGEDAFHAFYRIALELLFGRTGGIGHQSLGGDARLAGGALFPAHLPALVSADVHVLSGKQRGDLSHYVLQEAEGELAAGAQDNVRRAPGVEVCHRKFVTGELGIGTDGGHAMAGHLDFGYHRDEVLGGIGHHFPHFFLGIIPRGNGAVKLGAGGSHLREQRILLDLDAPALVVGEVPVHDVDLVLRENVDVLFDFIYAHEVACSIHHETTPAETGIILDPDTGEGSVRLQLGKGLAGIEEAGLGGSDGLDAAGRHFEGVAFLGEAALGVQFEDHILLSLLRENKTPILHLHVGRGRNKLRHKCCYESEKFYHLIMSLRTICPISALS